jgi:hypothetical protein
MDVIRSSETLVHVISQKIATFIKYRCENITPYIIIIFIIIIYLFQLKRWTGFAYTYAHTWNVFVSPMLVDDYPGRLV